MILHVYTVVRNEAAILPHFLRHYESIADRIFVLDDASTDDTPAILASHPLVTVLPYPFSTGLDDRDIGRAYRGAYVTHSRGVADWVCVPDVDECLWSPDGLRTVLAREAKPAILRCAWGWHMVADDFPQSLADVREGVSAGRAWRKPIIFDPVLNLRWGPGRHYAFGGEKRLTPVHLLHYRYLGLDWSLERTARNLRSAAQSSPMNKQKVVGPDAAATIAENLRLTRVRYAQALLERQPVLEVAAHG